MCTVIVGFNLWEGAPVIIAANRDEQLDRPAASPQIWSGKPAMLAPVDLARRGTWIGVNEYGVFAALTNRADIASVRGQESRGDLVCMALQARNARDAVLSLVALDQRRYNGFRIVIGDVAHGMWLLEGSGREPRHHTEPAIAMQLHPANSALWIVSNLGVGPDHSPRAKALCETWAAQRLQHDAPHRGTWNTLLTIHDPRPDPHPGATRRMASTCIHRPPEQNYGTRSSAFIVLSPERGAHGAEWRYWHREGHACQGRWNREIALQIIG